MHDTAKVITLYGDKTRKAEPTEHIINFPGGHVAVMRTTDGDYWAHITRDREDWNDGSGVGAITDSRIDREDSAPVSLPDDASIYHVAVRIARKVTR